VDGLTVQLSPGLALGQGRSATLVADSADHPTNVEFAIVNQAGGKVLSKPLPAGWVPFFAPAPLPPANGGPGVVAPRFRTVVFPDSPNGPSAYYAMVSNADGSRQAFVSFPLTQGGDPTVVSFPEGWYVAGCTPAINVFGIQLSNSRVLAGSRDRTVLTRQPCKADGFLQLNLEANSMAVFPLQSQAQVDVGSLRLLNDYIYGFNPTTGRSTDTVYTFDGATGTLLQPLGTSVSTAGFTTPLQEVTQLNLLVSEATNRTAGDAGLIQFDLDNQLVTPLSLPEGFDSVTVAGIFPATRKVAAIGLLSGGRGSQFIIYDLTNDSVTRVNNPPGVAFIGSRPGAARPGGPGAPGAPGGPGVGPGAGGGGAAAAARLISPNPKANTISAVGVNAAGNQTAIVVVRIP
jgi:hypothetical protein